jgi:hypothetical protein
MFNRIETTLTIENERQAGIEPTNGPALGVYSSPSLLYRIYIPIYSVVFPLTLSVDRLRPDPWVGVSDLDAIVWRGLSSGLERKSCRKRGIEIK